MENARSVGLKRIRASWHSPDNPPYRWFISPIIALYWSNIDIVETPTSGGPHRPPEAASQIAASRRGNSLGDSGSRGGHFSGDLNEGLAVGCGEVGDAGVVMVGI